MIVQSFTYNANFVRVIDGDTVVLNIDLGMKIWAMGQHVRLFGINTPELIGPDASSAADAKIWLNGALSVARKIIVQTAKPEAGDKYGRWLATIVADGTNLNQMMVTLGLAKEYFGKGPKE